MQYLRGQDGWRHLVTKAGLRGDLGLGAASALCYAAATQHRVYILAREDKQRNDQTMGKNQTKQKITADDLLFVRVTTKLFSF